VNAYFMIVLLGVILFYVVWGLGWLLERLSHIFLNVTRNPGSRAWYMLVGPGVALHESSHALGCVFTRTKIVEFKPVNITVEDDQIVLGYVKYINPKSAIKRAVINLAPVAVSLTLLVFVALGASYLVPEEFRTGAGGAAIELLSRLIDMKNISSTPMLDPLWQIGSFVYTFFYDFAGLTVVNPIFWIVSFLAMTIMFSNAPSKVDIMNASKGLQYIMIFNIVWLIIAAFFPQIGFITFGLYELLAVLFALAIGFAAIAYGFFLMITAMAKLKTPYNLLPLISMILTGVLLYLFPLGTPQFHTIIAISVFTAIALLLLAIKQLRTE
jgi:hypothetical protein